MKVECGGYKTWESRQKRKASSWHLCGQPLNCVVQLFFHFTQCALVDWNFAQIGHKAGTLIFTIGFCLSILPTCSLSCFFCNFPQKGGVPAYSTSNCLRSPKNSAPSARTFGLAFSEMITTLTRSCINFLMGPVWPVRPIMAESGSCIDMCETH